MAVIVYFPPSDMTAAQYDGVMEDLKKTSPWPARGLLSHACFTDQGKLSVCDIWDSEESFKTFGETLMPILAKRGANPGEPYISPCHNYLIPEPARA